jgi:hypothetical protein
MGYLGYGLRGVRLYLDEVANQLLTDKNNTYYDGITDLFYGFSQILNSFTGIINKVKLLDQQIIFTLFLPVAFSDPDPT